MTLKENRKLSDKWSGPRLRLRTLRSSLLAALGGSTGMDGSQISSVACFRYEGYRSQKTSLSRLCVIHLILGLHVTSQKILNLKY